MQSSLKSLGAILLTIGLLSGPTIRDAVADEYNGGLPRLQHVRASGTDRIIVKSKRTAAIQTWQAKLPAATGTRVIAAQAMTADTQVLQLQARLSGDALASALRQIESEPDVVFAAPDLRRQAHALTSDPLLASQWYLLSEQASATRTEQAWDMTTGSQEIIVAVLDTGVRFDHPDLGRVESGGKLLAGYDFVSRISVANDGDGRDADPSDPGDWVTEADTTQPDLTDCDVTDSSWHGTRVAALIGAMTNNASGIAGAAWTTRVLPVRVLGKCGGFDSDIITAMRWAAGLSVAGVPTNPTPASIINLSLGGDGACTAAYQSAVDEITARGVLLVASAGNDGGPVSAPANCAGVLGVAGIRHIGTKVGFSNLGTEVSIAAPGGNCVNTGFGQPCLFSIVVASDSGNTQPLTPIYTDEINYNVGTSFSAPQAASAVALMRSVNSQLVPSQLITLLKQTAVSFPVNNSGAIPTCHVPTASTDIQATECNCTTQTCGAGMLDTFAAVSAAQRPTAILQTTGTVTNGATLAIDASSSFAANGRSIAAFQWAIENLNGTAPSIAAPSQASTTLQIPGSTQFTLRLTVTDDQGGVDIEDLTLTTPAAPPVSPPTNSGGGGQPGWELLLLAALLRRNPLRCRVST